MVVKSQPMRGPRQCRVGGLRDSGRVFDIAKINGPLEVRYTNDDEDYRTFSGQTGHPDPSEVVSWTS